MQHSRSIGPYGRVTELQLLKRELLTKRASTVCLHGARGSGRTSLAKHFLDSQLDAFPGGTYWVMGGDREEIGPDQVDLSHIDELGLEEHSLVVFDDADAMPLNTLSREVGELRQKRPFCQALLTSVLPIHIGHESVTVAMPPLSTEGILAILRSEAPLPPDQLEGLAGHIEGSPLLANLVADRLAAGMPWRALLRLLEQAPQPGLVDPRGEPLDSSTVNQIEVITGDVSDRLIEALNREPELMYELDPRRLEELVVELYRRQGFDAQLTPASGDEGVDVYVTESNDLGRSLTVVQVKRHAPHNKVGVGVVRELLGTLDIQGASSGVLLTTSFFTKGAMELEQKFRYRLSLRDYFALQDLLRKGANA